MSGELPRVFVVRIEGDGGRVDYVLCSPVAQVKQPSGPVANDEIVDEGGRRVPLDANTWAHLHSLFAPAFDSEEEFRAKQLDDVQLLAGRAGPTNHD